MSDHLNPATAPSIAGPKPSKTMSPAALPASEADHTVSSQKGDIPVERLPQVQALAKTDPSDGVKLAEQIIADFVTKMNAKHGIAPPSPAAVNPQHEPSPTV